MMTSHHADGSIGLNAPLIDDRIRRRYFKDAPVDEIEEYNAFVRRNPKRIYRGPSGKSTAYYALGEGPKALFIPAAGMGFLPGELAFRGLSHLARSFRVICADPVFALDLAEIVETYDGLLDGEGVKKVFLYGSSGAGLSAQLFFKRRFDRVERLVLSNTIAVSSARVHKFNRDRRLTALLPAPLVRRALLGAGGRLLKAEIPPELGGRMNFLAGLTRFLIVRYFTKPKLAAVMTMIANFAAEGGLAAPDYSTWPGKALIITAEADPGFRDAAVLATLLPGSRMHTFGKQYGHIVAYIAEDEYYGVIEQFLQ
jgi:pimeloyl-ACP methyl ester carboxylesterase